MQFSHLHNHTQYSLLDGASKIKNLYKKAIDDQMPAVAITDHGNMFGVFKFVAEAWANLDVNHQPKVKPIVGCEFYLVEDRHKKIFTKEKKDKRYHQLLLAKNDIGYKNLTKLCSLGFIEGLYGKYPRIDKELLMQYSEGLIATSCCIGAEIPQALMNEGEELAEQKLKWWLDLFGDDFYLEVQRHGMPQEDLVNHSLIKFSEKYNIPVICTNDSHYTEREDYNAHDTLLCINTGAKKNWQIIKDIEASETIGKDTRFGFFNDEFFFKTKKEMNQVFHDMPHVLDNTQMIVDKIEVLNLKKDILLPNFPLPNEFSNQDDYLADLTWKGAHKKYIEITSEIEERINFELSTIRKMGFAGYFLIVADFINAGKNMGVRVGPGRGSAAGSVVAFCVGITNIDPIKYGLLFERFLNPERASMPDIDTDFDDVNRQKVIDYVVDKYTYRQVAHIVTYGTMAAKMSIKDVARVSDLPLPDSNYLAKLVPDTPGTSLQDVFHTQFSQLKFKGEDLDNIKIIREVYNTNNNQGDILKQAEKLEGSVRGTGIHAAGIIIAPQDLSNIMPVCTNKDVNLLITQYDGKVVEDAGVIKMDFLGLRTLSIINDTLNIIKKVHHIEIDIDNIELNDKKTFQLYQKGLTNGIFQFESKGMQKHLKELAPDKFEDLIAMNALYRPGPMEYIPNFIKRKHGFENITYDLDGMEEYLAETYGITVYQEQVMLLSQKIANFTKGDADILRKAMGKKQKETLDKMKGKFLENGIANGHNETKLNKVWTDWEAFAQYAFNKSHSTCYALVSYQTAYLKAHYPSAFMAAVLNNSDSIDKISFFLQECQSLCIKVLGPDVNESDLGFTTNKEGVIRFGLNAIKGSGEKSSIEIVNNRTEHGKFKSIFDFVERLDLTSVTKKSIECLALAGALDEIDTIQREQYVLNASGKKNGAEILHNYGRSKQSSYNSNQLSLFGEVTESLFEKPNIPIVEKWTLTEKLKFEKEMIGLYLSAHPLDRYAFEIANYQIQDISKISAALERLNDKLLLDRQQTDDEKKLIKSIKEKPSISVRILGTVTNVQDLQAQNGNLYMRFKLEDKEGEMEFFLFSDNYYNLGKYIKLNSIVLLELELKISTYREIKYETSVLNVVPLSSVKHRYTKRIIIKSSLKEINEEFITFLNSKIETVEFPGNNYTIEIEDLDSKTLALRNNRNSIILDDELIDFFKERNQYGFEIISN